MCQPNVYVTDLVRAFKNVHKRYYNSEAFNKHNSDIVDQFDDTEKNIYTQFVERVFAYELYHQFRIIIDSKENDYKNKKLVLNAEIAKLDYQDTIVEKNFIVPDMVLHKKQTDRESRYQQLFVEIKSRPNTPLCEDVKKLFNAVSPRLNYQAGVMICINYSKDKITGIVSKAIEKVKIADKNLLTEKLWLLTDIDKEILNFKNIK